jgi:HAD superfamily hydrolase (TIGR01548 family)
MAKPKGNPSGTTVQVLLFDMDGVLIDVSKSYRRTIQKTVDLYLETCLGFRRERERWSLDEAISLLKSAGGFNNDWDLTRALLLYILSLSDLPAAPKKKRFTSLPALFNDLQTRTAEFKGSRKIPVKRKPFLRFLGRAKALGGGLKGVHRALKKSPEGWIYGEGRLDRENLIERIFQEIYLGRAFSGCYRLPRYFYRGEGDYLREKLLIPRKTLSRLKKKFHLGIASGRPRFEAELALKRFHLLPYFESIVTLDECRKEEDRILRRTGRRVRRTKPHPYPLLKAIEAMGLSAPSCAYVGDVVDDMTAARMANKTFPMLAIGFISRPHGTKQAKEILQRAGAKAVVGRPQDLLEYLRPFQAGQSLRNDLPK